MMISIRGQQLCHTGEVSVTLSKQIPFRDSAPSCGHEAGSYLRLIDSCITQLKPQENSRTCSESEEEEQALPPDRFRDSNHVTPWRIQGYLAHQKQPPRRTLQDYVQGPIVAIGRGGVSFERGTPVPTRPPSDGVCIPTHAMVEQELGPGEKGEARSLISQLDSRGEAGFLEHTARPP